MSDKESIYTTIHQYLYELVCQKEIDIIQTVILSDVEYFCYRKMQYYKTNEDLSNQLGISGRSVKKNQI